MNQIKIGIFLKQLRTEKQLTQEQLAEQLNVSNRTISRWENGYNLPDLSTLVELANYYMVDISEIIDGEKNHKNEKTIPLSFIEYTQKEKEMYNKKLLNNSIATLCFILVSSLLMIIEGIPSDKAHINSIYAITFGCVIGLCLFNIFYLTGTFKKLNQSRLDLLRKYQNKDKANKK